MKIGKLIIATALLATQLPALAANVPVKLYKNPNCGCCDAYAAHLEANGFNVEMVNTHDMDAVKKKHAVPERLEGCHTALISGYVFEGLIPAANIKTVLEKRLPIKGLSVPGMPVGAPGMPGKKQGPIHVYYMDAAAKPKVYASF